MNELPAEPILNPSVICLLPARNAAADLPAFLDSARRCCDGVIALDDGSSDDTYDILASDPLVKLLLRGPHRHDYRRWDDAANRNRLLTAATEFRPEWILSLDADERIDESDARGLKLFLETDALPGCAYGFRHVPMRDDLLHFWPKYQWVYRLFSFEQGQRFPAQRLHFIPVPVSIPRQRWIKTTLRIQHLGEMTRERRLARFSKYLEADPDRKYQADYSESLKSPNGQHLRRWQPRPEGMPVLMAGVPETVDDHHDGNPALSVVVIAQDDESTIAASITAIVEQACPAPFEVIVVTSGSDRTADRVRSGFPCVRVIELLRPALPGEARNVGLHVARGTYVSFPGSHVQLQPGSLAARLQSHRRGYAMVTGVTENGTRTPAGWASYFLDHSEGLPGHAPAQLNGPPAHCSYAKLPLLEVGGFPEGVRTAEDTIVNRELVRRGYVAFRDPRIRFVHRSPCTTWMRLVRHHFGRGRGWGRMQLAAHQQTGTLVNRDLIVSRFFMHLPGRLRRIARGVDHASPELRDEFKRVRVGVVLGAISAWAGMWLELVRPGPGKWSVLVGHPGRMALIVATGRATIVHLVQIDPGGEYTIAQEISPHLHVLLPSGASTTLDQLAQTLAIEAELDRDHPFSLRNTLRNALAGALDIDRLDYLIGPDQILSNLFPGLYRDPATRVRIPRLYPVQTLIDAVRAVRSRELATSFRPWALRETMRSLNNQEHGAQADKPRSTSTAGQHNRI